MATFSGKGYMKFLEEYLSFITLYLFGLPRKPILLLIPKLKTIQFTTISDNYYEHKNFLLEEGI